MRDKTKPICFSKHLDVVSSWKTGHFNDDDKNGLENYRKVPIEDTSRLRKATTNIKSKKMLLERLNILRGR